MPNVLPVVAYSACCATGMHLDQSMSAVFSSHSGLSPAGDIYPTHSYIGQLPAEPAELPAEFGQYNSRQARMALHAVGGVAEAVDAAVERWGAGRVAVMVGTSTGGMLETEAQYRSFRDTDSETLDLQILGQHAFNAAAQMLAGYLGVSGPALAVSTACSSSAKIIGSANRMMDADFIDAAVLVGVDTLCQLTVRGFAGLNLLAADQSRPFDADRDGINIGEASAAMVVERRARHARVGVFGVGEASGGHHMTQPHPDGLGAADAMRLALADAQLSPDDIDAVSAHGTATPSNDTVESRAIVACVGDEVPVYSTKGLTGHTLGACGALETVIALEALQRGRLPGTFGLRETAGDIDANVRREADDFDGHFILSNTLAFGDNNVSLILGSL